MAKKNSFLRRVLISVVLLSLLTSSAFVKAEETKVSEIESGKVILSWKAFKQLLDEIDHLKQIIEQEQERREEMPIPPPIDYAITKADYGGTIGKSFCRLNAELSVDVLKQGWVIIPFFSQNVGIESVFLRVSNPSEDKGEADSGSLNAAPSQTEPPAHLERSEKGCRLIAKGPCRVDMKAVISVPIQVEDLSHTFSFEPPNSVMNRIELRFKEKGVNIIHASPQGEVWQGEEETVFRSLLAAGVSVMLGWKMEKDAGIQRKSAATLRALASISKSAMTIHSRISLRHIASLEAIELVVPADVEILNVTGPEMESWTTKVAEGHQVIRLSGDTERHSQTEIVLMHRLKITSLPTQADVPMVKIKGVDVFEGFLGIEILDNLDILSDKVEKGDLIPPKNLPKVIWQGASSPILHGYHFHSDSFGTHLSIKSYQEVQTVVANVDMAEGITHRTLEGKSITRVKYFIRNNDRQFLTLSLPDNSRIWQAFLDGGPVKPAQKESGEILIPMKKSSTQGEEFKSFSIEIGYITDVEKLTLKGDILNRLPKIDIPASYLQWKLYLPEYYEYSGFEGPLKQVRMFTGAHATHQKFQIEIPARGKAFLFEKYLIVDEMPYVRGKYGQHLGDNIFLTVQPYPRQRRHPREEAAVPAQQKEVMDTRDFKYGEQQQITPNYMRK